MLCRFTVVAAFVVIVLAQPVHSCGFIESAGKLVTLRDDAAASKLVLYGRLENPQGGPEAGSIDLVISKILKGDPVLDGKKVIRIPRYLPIPDPKNAPHFLVFAEVKGGKLDYFKGVQGNKALADYVAGVTAIDTKERVKLMRYCFDFLDHEEPVIALDAFNEFLKSTDPDISKAARTLSADKLRRWLQHDKTSPDRLRLYAFLLANCGNQQDAVLLRKLLDRFVKLETPPLIDGIFTAYTLLRPNEGWAYTSQLLKDPNATFLVRYAALRATRYFYTTQPGVVSEKALLAAFGSALEHADLADFPMEYLRQWKCWKLTDQILPLAQKQQGFENPVIQRNILRYALQCPDAPANRFVAAMRKTDPSLVRETEAWLRQEANAKVEEP